jgi:hypothetical protein
VFRIGRPARLGELAFALWLLVMGASAGGIAAGDDG